MIWPNPLMGIAAIAPGITVSWFVLGLAGFWRRSSVVANLYFFHSPPRSIWNSSEGRQFSPACRLSNVLSAVAARRRIWESTQELGLVKFAVPKLNTGFRPSGEP